MIESSFSTEESSMLKKLWATERRSNSSQVDKSDNSEFLYMNLMIFVKTNCIENEISC